MNSTINEWFGRFGNNIQQISNALYYCQKNKINFICPRHDLIKQFSVNFGEHKNISNRFFFYNGKEKDFDVDEIFLNKCRKELCLKYIVPNLNFKIEKSYDDDVVVIHIRAGDVFSEFPSNVYVPNPINFYKKIIKLYNKTIIVTEDVNNIVVKNLYNTESKNIQLQSSSVQEDFATLLRAKNLVTSGVGTFSIAAALCSINLKNLYYTDLYLTEHLNPTMLQSDEDVFLHLTKLQNYIKIGEWKNSPEQLNTIINFNV